MRSNPIPACSFLNGVACMPVSIALLIGNPVAGAIIGRGPNFKWVQGAGFCCVSSFKLI